MEAFDWNSAVCPDGLARVPIIIDRLSPEDPKAQMQRVSKLTEEHAEKDGWMLVRTEAGATVTWMTDGKMMSSDNHRKNKAVLCFIRKKAS